LGTPINISKYLARLFTGPSSIYAGGSESPPESLNIIDTGTQNFLRFLLIYCHFKEYISFRSSFLSIIYRLFKIKQKDEFKQYRQENPA